MRLKVFLIFLSEILTTYPEQNCIWESDEGQYYDIQKIKKQDNYLISDQLGAMSMFNMMYEFNFCSNNVKCHQQEVAAKEILEVNGADTENCDILGKLQTQKISLLNKFKPEQGIRIDYSQGDQCFEIVEDTNNTQLQENNMILVERSASFEILCSDYDSINWQIIQNTGCHITLSLNHTLGCGSNKNPSKNSKNISKKNFIQIVLSYSNILLSLIFWFAVYIGFGSYLNKKKYGLTGIQAIPHLEFWNDLPYLFKDGIFYVLKLTLNFVKQIKRKSSTNQYTLV